MVGRIRPLSRPFRAAAAALLAMLAGGAAAEEDPGRPNILWITAEDMGPHLGSFGDLYAVTPHLDRLAAQGVRYVNAFAPVGVCAPSRSSLILGLYAPAAGTQHMRSATAIPPGVRLFPQVLREAGYYATNNAKEDYNLARTPPDAWDESSPRAHWRNRKPGQPFFAVFNLGSTHEAQIRLPEEEHRRQTAGFAAHDPAMAPVPPYHPDLPEVRRDWARYADRITLMDRQAGAILRQLDEDGLADQTLVFFYSDHGAGMPRSKRWLYDSSLRVPLIVRFPPRDQRFSPEPAGGLSDRMVAFVDLGPTVLALAGVAAPASMQGRAFLGPGAAPPPSYVYGFRDRMDERYDMLRSVRDRRYRYIRNFLPHRPYAQHIAYMYEMPTMRVWQRLFDQGRLVGPQKRFFLPKPPEELYDTWADPHEVHNLAGEADYGRVRARLAAELDRWMLEIRDTGLLPEAEMIARARGTTVYEMACDPARFEPARLLAAATLASRRDVALRPRLVGLLSDADSGVRYWAATGLAALGAEAAPAAVALRLARSDASASVRIAAAEALAAAGRPGEALPVLAAALRSPQETVRLHAANVIDLLGPDARAILGDLETALAAEPEESYPRRVLPRTIERLRAAPSARSAGRGR